MICFTLKLIFLSLLVFISEIVIFLGLLGILFYYSPYVLLKVLPFLLFFLFLFYFFFNKKIKKIGQEKKKNDYLKTKKFKKVLEE